MGKLVQQFMKFGVVGVIAFVIDYGLMVALTELAGVNYLISATISFTVSVVFNYLASMRYVFTHKQGLSRRREFVIFVVLSVIGLGVNDLLMWLGSSVLGSELPHRENRRHGHRHGVQLRDAQDLPRRRHRRRSRSSWPSRRSEGEPFLGQEPISVTGRFCGRQSRRVGYSFGVPFSKNW